jgi:hypothetical protein
MSTHNTTHRLIDVFRHVSLMMLIMFLVSACGFWGASSASKDATSVPDEPVKMEERDRSDEGITHSAAGEPGAEESSVGAGDRPLETEKEVEALAPAPTPSPLPAATAVPAPAESGFGDSDYAAADDRGGEEAAEALPEGGVVASDEMKSVEAESAGETAAMEVQQSEPLRAGEVDDNTNWDDYLLYRRNYRGPQVRDRDVSERYIIEVKDGQGNPVLDANVRVFLAGQQQREEVYSARTYANGQTLFQPLALDVPSQQVDSFVVEVQKDNLLEQFTLTRFDAQASTSFTERWTVTLDMQKQFDTINLDVLFLIDATGSMADEIAKIQSTIFDVSAQIDALPGQPNVRYGMVTYRDRGDSFVSKVYDFTPDVRDFSKNLSTVWANGGGDYPESLNEGLHKAVNQVEWRSEDTVKLIFLVADAPPHLDYTQDYDYAVEMENAARRGIKIFPIASSGLDDQGEYIFRQLAQYTMGRFIFLTYEGPTNAGEPGDVTTHHVEDYSVENLDDLLVRLVEEELAWQNPQLARGQ